MPIDENAPSSPGIRVLALLHRVLGTSTQTPAISTWAPIIGGRSDTPIDHFEITRRLGLWSAQVRLLESQMRAAGLPNELTSPTISALQNSLSVVELGNQWDAVVRRQLTAEVITAVKYAAGLLPRPDVVPSARELLRLTRIARLMSRAAESDPSLSEEGKAFVREQSERYLQAVGDCEIVGMQALVHEVQALTTARIASPRVLESASSRRIEGLMNALYQGSIRVTTAVITHNGSPSLLRASTFAVLGAGYLAGLLTQDQANWALGAVNVAIDLPRIGSGQPAQEQREDSHP